MQILILLSLVVQKLFYEAQQGEIFAVQGDNKRTSVLMFNKQVLDYIKQKYYSAMQQFILMVNTKLKVALHYFGASSKGQVKVFLKLFTWICHQTNISSLSQLIDCLNLNNYVSIIILPPLYLIFRTYVILIRNTCIPHPLGCSIF